MDAMAFLIPAAAFSPSFRAEPGPETDSMGINILPRVAESLLSRSFSPLSRQRQLQRRVGPERSLAVLRPRCVVAWLRVAPAREEKGTVQADLQNPYGHLCRAWPATRRVRLLVMIRAIHWCKA